MRKIIDAHVHIYPSDLSGFYDPYVGTWFYDYGKMAFCDGKVIQKLPVILKDSCFDADVLVRLMNEYHVEKSVIMQSGSPAFMAVTCEAVAAFPQRIGGAVAPDFKDPFHLKMLDEYYKRGLRVIKFLFAEDMGLTCPLRNPEFDFESEQVCDYLERAEKYGMTIALDIFGVMSCGYQIDAFENAVKNFRGLKFVFCHLGMPPFKEGWTEEAVKRWRRILRLGRESNVWFDVAALPEIIGGEEYPYPTAPRLVRDFIDEYGAGKLIWGSDIPQTLTDSSYRQMIHMYEKSPLLTETEKQKLFYENAMDVYFSAL